MASAKKGSKPSLKAESLLVELRTEELPPKSLRRLGEVFAEGLTKALREAYLLTEASVTTPYATPRRLAVHITNVLAQQPDRDQNRQGPKEGAPPQAVEGFARGLGVSVDKLTVQDGRYAYTVRIKGEPLAKLVPDFAAQALKALPMPKVMRWGEGETQFVRPVHGLILLHGGKVIPGTVLGIKSGNKTLGHRFLSKASVTITRADKYADILRKSGRVMASFSERKAEIEKQLQTAARKHKAYAFPPSDWTGGEKVSDAEMMDRRLVACTILGANTELLDEVTAIVEWPVVYAGEFDSEYLKVPAQCIGLTMQKNQKYFALMSENLELLPKYLLVSNLETADPGNIVRGNERVLRARLADAKFFYEQDQKVKLADRAPRLANVVYHNRLGSQLERVQRIQKLAGEIARRLGADVSAAERAAWLCKADLLTEMVGEFPELQGIMGFFYARYDAESDVVANAIVSHYLPRYAGDFLPRTSVAQALALADKLDTLVGIYGIGLAPTGDKDPFGLRRQALGIARILVEKSLPLNLADLLQLARSQFPAGVVAESVAQDLIVFIADRLRPWLREQDFEADEIEAVLALGVTRLDQLLPRLKALKAFRRLPEAEALAAANKRIRNILKQAGGKPRDGVDASLLREDAERVLAEQVNARRAEVEPLFAKGEFEAALCRLASLRAPVDTFFDKVMVMVEDEPLKQNRLALLNSLSNLFLGAADISRLQG